MAKKDSPAKFLGGVGKALKGFAGKAQEFGNKLSGAPEGTRGSFDSKLAMQKKETSDEMKADKTAQREEANEEKVAGSAAYASSPAKMLSGNYNMGGGFGTSMPVQDQTDMTSNASAMYRKKKGW